MAEMNGAVGFWVFGYGSLMWRPGFAFEERRRARLEGWRRRFCLRSIHYRGTPERPGLVLGLDAAPGDVCEGVAFRVGSAAGAETLAYLRERELISYAYREARLAARLEDGREVEALAFVVDPAHPQYAGPLPFEEQAATIARCCGPMGPNAEYLRNTADHLAELGVEDPEIAALDARVRELTATPAGAGG